MDKILSLPEIEELERLRNTAAMTGPFTAREMHPEHPLPVSCVRYGLVDELRHVEVFRVWERSDCEFSEKLLNNLHSLLSTARAYHELREAVRFMHKHDREGYARDANDEGLPDHYRNSARVLLTAIITPTARGGE